MQRVILNSAQDDRTSNLVRMTGRRIFSGRADLVPAYYSVFMKATKSAFWSSFISILKRWT